MKINFTIRSTVFWWGLLLSTLCYSQNYDVRSARWGMTKEQVIKSESGKKPIKDDDGNLFFSGIEVAKCPVVVEYKFTANKLNEAYYWVKAETAAEMLYHWNFEAIQRRLEEKYGDKPKGGYVWHKETYKANTQEYGYAIRIGDLAILYEWMINHRTRIVHAIMGRDNKVSHTVTFEQLPTDDF